MDPDSPALATEQNHRRHVLADISGMAFCFSSLQNSGVTSPVRCLWVSVPPMDLLTFDPEPSSMFASKEKKVAGLFRSLVYRETTRKMILFSYHHLAHLCTLVLPVAPTNLGSLLLSAKSWRNSPPFIRGSSVVVDIS